MRTTVSLDDELLADAQEYTGIKEKSALVNAALKALVEREAARRFARLGGREPDLKPIPRRRPPRSDPRRHLGLDRPPERAIRFVAPRRQTCADASLRVRRACHGRLARDPGPVLVQRLPEMRPARDSEVLALVDGARLFATGIGYVDAHLLAAVRLVPDTQFWTRDKRLREIAERLSIAANPT